MLWGQIFSSKWFASAWYCLIIVRNDQENNLQTKGVPIIGDWACGSGSILKLFWPTAKVNKNIYLIVAEMEFNCRSLDKSTSIFFAFSTSSLGPRTVTLSEFASAAIENYRRKTKKLNIFLWMPANSGFLNYLLTWKFYSNSSTIIRDGLDKFSASTDHHIVNLRWNNHINWKT